MLLETGRVPQLSGNRLRLKRDGTRAESRFRLSAKRTSQFKSAGASVQSTTGSRGVRISGSNGVYTMFRGSVKSTGYSLHSPVSPSLPLPCVTACHHISTGLYLAFRGTRRFAIVQFIKPNLHALQCEHNRYTIPYMPRHFLSAIIRASLYRSNLYPSNWSVMRGTVTDIHIKIRLKHKTCNILH